MPNDHEQELPLCLANLSKIDFGKAAACFDEGLRLCIADLKDRPEDGTARKVTLTVELRPGEIEARELDTATVAFRVKSSVPIKHTQPHNMRVAKRQLIFNPHCAENPRQSTFNMGDPDDSRGDQIPTTE